MARAKTDGLVSVTLEMSPTFCGGNVRARAECRARITKAQIVVVECVSIEQLSGSRFSMHTPLRFDRRSGRPIPRPALFSHWRLVETKECDDATVKP